MAAPLGLHSPATTLPQPQYNPASACLPCLPACLPACSELLELYATRKAAAAAREGGQGEDEYEGLDEEELGDDEAAEELRARRVCAAACAHCAPPARRAVATCLWAPVAACVGVVLWLAAGVTTGGHLVPCASHVPTCCVALSCPGLLGCCRRSGGSRPLRSGWLRSWTQRPWPATSCCPGTRRFGR